MTVLFYYLSGVSLISFMMMGYDKYLARNQKRRLSEFTLLFWAFLGGSIGAGIGMWVFNHKTSKGSFLWKFFCLFLLQLVLFYFGMQTFKS
jgi:uncharacterized membrane protein YsdA (DUF1294 family)